MIRFSFPDGNTKEFDEKAFDNEEGKKAFLEKRKPDFSKYPKLP